jgi:hypothetical protein
MFKYPPAPGLSRELNVLRSCRVKTYKVEIFVKLEFKLFLPKISSPIQFSWKRQAAHCFDRGLLYNFRLCNVLTLDIKSRGMRWAGHVARMGRRRMHIGYW